MKLYGFPPSPNTRKVQAVAAHLGIPLELVLVSLPKGESRTAEFLVLNPGGRTPARRWRRHVVGIECDHAVPGEQEEKCAMA